MRMQISTSTGVVQAMSFSLFDFIALPSPKLSTKAPATQYKRLVVPVPARYRWRRLPRSAPALAGPTPKKMARVTITRAIRGSGRKGLFPCNHADDVAGSENLALHRGDDRGAVGRRGIEIEPRAQGKDLKVVGMSLTCRRLRSDVARLAAHVLALAGAVLECGTGGDGVWRPFGGGGGGGGGASGH